MSDITRVVLFGAPGSGKGTQAVMISEYLKIKRISLGDILREEVKSGSDLGEEVKSYMSKGALVPDELVSRVIEENIDSQGFLLDGYPRNLSQANKLEEILKKKNSDVDIFIYLDVDKDTIAERLSKRRICKSCGASYHLANMPPKKEGVCDICKGELTQRKDDQPEVIDKRWQVFLEESQRVLSFYKKHGKVVEIDGKGNKDEIFSKVKAALR